MIRRVYFDLIKKKISKKDLGWIFQRGLQYSMIHASHIIERPLCGPILGTFLTNYSCNYRCKMCDLPSRGDHLKKMGLKELPTLQLKKLLKDFADLGTSGIGFTGGEPLLREDIFELIRYTNELGMISHLNTNGSLLDDEKADKLLASGVDSVNISLDGAVPATHNRIRGCGDAFEKAVAAISRLIRSRTEKRLASRIKIVAVISEDNIDEIPDLVNLAADLKTDCIEFIPEQNFKPMTCPRAVRPIRYSDIFFAKLDKTIDYLLKVKNIKIENSRRHLKLFKKSFKNEKSPLACYAGYNSFGVDCYGLIYPCVPWFNWAKAVGNTRDATLKDFWYSKTYNVIRKEISKCRDCYLNCQTELNLLFTL